MTIPSNDEIRRYVTNKFGSQKAIKLDSIHTGGQNNTKGNDYENFFTIYKILEIAHDHKLNLKEHQVQNQCYGFVDDVCHIDYQLKHKHNYQLKNSCSSASDWTTELEERFYMQTNIDLEKLDCICSYNYLVVPSTIKCTENTKRIQATTALDSSKCQCIFFPNCSTTLELIQNTQIEQYLKTLITPDASLSDADYAIRILLGILKSNKVTNSLEDFFKLAGTESQPNPFIQLNFISTKTELTAHVQHFLDNHFKDLDYQVQYGRVFIKIGGFKTEAPLDSINALTSEKLSSIKSLGDFLQLLSRAVAEQFKKPQ